MYTVMLGYVLYASIQAVSVGRKVYSVLDHGT